MLYSDIMQTIRWQTIVPVESFVHIATIEMKRMGSPEMHRHDFFECFAVLEGEGRQETPGGADSLRPGQIHFVRPGHAHRIVNENGLVFLNMAFEADLFGGLDAATSLAETLWGAGGPIRAVTLQPPQLAGIRDAAVEAAHLPDRRSAAWLLLEIARRAARDEAPAGVAAILPDWFAEGQIGRAHV